MTPEERWNKELTRKSIDLTNLVVTADDPVLKNGSGEWLGTVRSFIQRKCTNGETVVWESNDVLTFNGTLTVKEMESLAAKIAESAVNEFIKKLNHNGVKQ